jgi:hypothetical protein
MTRKEQNDLYRKLSKAFLKEHPECQVRGCWNRSKDLHHIAGRTGFLLTHTPFFLAVCRSCHEDIHFGATRGKGPAWAKANGYLRTLTYKEHRELKDELQQLSETREGSSSA